MISKTSSSHALGTFS